MPREGYYLPERGLVDQASQTFIEAAHVPRSRFTGKAQILTTFDAGLLVPFHVEEVLPGDHFKLRTHAYVRMATPLFPLYSEQRVDVHWFYCPNRLVWTNWVRMMGQQDAPGDSIAFTVPQVTSNGNGFIVGAVYDYMGVAPTIGQASAPVSVSALPGRMYNLIYNQWYRDENLINSVSINTGDSANTETTANIGSLRRRAKSHDYFTSALPWAQKFTPPAALGTQAPVIGVGVANPPPAVGGSVAIQETVSTQFPTGQRTYTNSYDATAPFYMDVNASGVPQIFADLSSVSVNVLRQSFMVQALLERDARGGTRYVELMQSHFGVRSPDFRLQRTEFIGGQSVPIGTTPIAQTATGGGGVGSLGGSTAAFGQGEVSYAAVEHGYILGIMSVKSELVYQQGIPRHMSRLSRLDYYFPAMAMLGEMAVLRKEIYATGVSAQDDVVFGYMPAWDDYRYMISRATGLFRSTSAGNIDEWHTAQQFGSAPTLGQTFIEDTPPMTRVLAAGAAANGMQFLANIVVERDVVRPLPVHGTPASLDRF